jgi:hypothetical protein
LITRAGVAGKAGRRDKNKGHEGTKPRRVFEEIESACGHPEPRTCESEARDQRQCNKRRAKRRKAAG